MDFQRVAFDTDLDEIEADELRTLVRKFDEAQEQNIGEFEAATEQIDELEGRVGEVEDFDDELTDELAEVSPLSGDELAEFTIARKRDLLAEFSEEEDTDEEETDDEDDDGDDGEADFDDMGQQGPTHDDEEAAQEFADKYLGDIPGLNY